MNSVQLIALLTAALFLLQVVLFTSRNKLHDKQAFLWLLFAVASLIVAILLPQLNRLASSLGIAYLPAFIFMLAFFVILNLLIYQTTVISRNEKRLNLLIQKTAIQHKELEDLKREKGDSP
ncbi:DUF2304 domain-containing protein [Fictibacillus aquaticus]|uniref:DUF2304 domain-containing protein n=1 Tax=Fictibacillus aquaticus TaxID=2021314 RepID=A0A235F9Y5_9BACL|nr:DUF2304 domain-containing protein [Fictibacillus aquaticus]OYD57747.1 hypothetical protein CGZ90_13895 [Fictibacillus aquaticus]